MEEFGEFNRNILAYDFVNEFNQKVSLHHLRVKGSKLESKQVPQRFLSSENLGCEA